MDLSIYFHPVNIHDIFLSDQKQLKFGDIVNVYGEEGKFPSLEGFDIALIGVNEDRNAVHNLGCKDAPDEVRRFLYNLYQGAYRARIVDLGNIQQGHEVQDTYYALSQVAAFLIQHEIFPIIIGGSQDLSYAMYKAYEQLGQIINLVAVDPKFDLGDAEAPLNAETYLSKIILSQPNFLFNYTNIGYQSYFVDIKATALMRKLYFDINRLGLVRNDIEEVEPLLRNADMMSVDISAVRQSDAPGNLNASPNGFYGEEICQITKYAGLSDKLSSLGIFELNPQYDRNGQTAHLVAQMIWYFIDGFYGRKNDLPYTNKDQFIKYTVSLKEHNDQLVFYKSKKSDRWWMDVPVKSNNKESYSRHHLIPCSYADYEIALKDEVPDRWVKAFQKLM